MFRRLTQFCVAAIVATTLSAQQPPVERTVKPVLHAKHWVAITGKPLAATAGAMAFQKGGNAVDAAAAMIAATCTMWDTLSWGGETQALIYNPKTKQVIGVNALGVAPTGATADFYKSKEMKYPPEHGPLSALTPGTPGGIMTMVAEYGRLSLKDVLEPSIQMADGYAIEASVIRRITAEKEKLSGWPYSKAVMLPNDGNPPKPGQVFKQSDLAATLRKLIEAEQQALKRGKNRKEAIYAAYDRFYRGDIAKELVRGAREQGALLTEDDLGAWKVKLEEPIKTTYRGVEVYKLTTWTQGAALLQALNILENFDLKAMGFNSARYMHTVYQAMNLAFADRDFYYGDPDFPPAEPVRGLLSKEYARERAKSISMEKNDPNAGPGDPYPFQGEQNPFSDLLKDWAKTAATPKKTAEAQQAFERQFYLGTTSVQAADEEGWVVSVTPSGGWVPAVIAGKTGIGLSQRAQQFNVDPAENPYNVIEPRKRPRVTLTPSLALKDGKPFLSFSVQGGDSQDQNLLQLFLNVVEFGMNVQEATEAANINSFQMRNSFGKHETQPGKMQIRADVPSWVRKDLRAMGYELEVRDRTSGPLNAIWFDREHGTMWGGSSNFEEDYGIGW